MFHHHIFFPFFPGVFGWIFAAFLLVPYFLPTIVAFMRGKSNAGGVFILNFLLGWTVIGWVGSLIWALSSDNRSTVIANNPPVYHSNPPVYNTGYSGYGGQPAQPGQQTNPTIRPNVTSAASDKYDQLRKLKQLHDEGVLTDEEFNKQKAAILG
jgi:hypothetical protein